MSKDKKVQINKVRLKNKRNKNKKKVRKKAVKLVRKRPEAKNKGVEREKVKIKK